MIGKKEEQGCPFCEEELITTVSMCVRVCLLEELITAVSICVRVCLFRSLYLFLCVPVFVDRPPLKSLVLAAFTDSLKCVNVQAKSLPKTCFSPTYRDMANRVHHSEWDVEEHWTESI